MTFYSEVCTLEGSDRTLSVWVRAVLNYTAELYTFKVEPYPIPGSFLNLNI